MTKQKDLKRVIRTRMQKTGESYTTARLHLVKKEEVPDYAALAGVSEAAIQKGSGHPWSHWVKVLDGFESRVHGDMAAHINSLGVPGWWSQSVVVGYERIRGLRAKGQRRSGSWEASKSKTVPVTLAKATKAWTDPKIRKKWLPEKVTVRTGKSPKSIRLTWVDGTTVAVWFDAKGSKTSLGVQHLGLTSKEEMERLKKLWGERLEALAELF